MRFRRCAELAVHTLFIARHAVTFVQISILAEVHAPALLHHSFRFPAHFCNHRCSSRMHSKGMASDAKEPLHSLAHAMGACVTRRVTSSNFVHLFACIMMIALLMSSIVPHLLLLLLRLLPLVLFLIVLLPSIPPLRSSSFFSSDNSIPMLSPRAHLPFGAAMEL